MNNFFVKVGNEYQPLGELKEIDLTTDKETPTTTNKLSTESLSFSCDCTFEDVDGLNVVRKLMSGGDKGLYNGLTLKEEGKLTPKNAWL